ncbi:hypothetical protein SO802_006816 [Lithocarpus litseifolius]|uniref:Serine protease n=1 Tax=Lithocarpus litseifolius TaxID=425828 RepID=A0AAW2DQ79_9ROSI
MTPFGIAVWQQPMPESGQYRYNFSKTAHHKQPLAASVAHSKINVKSSAFCQLPMAIVNVEGIELKPVAVGTSQNLHVGQSCLAIGNPYGYENTLTTGVVSGLGREIPSPNGRAIQGAIQTDADINAGKFHFAFKYLKFLDNHHSFSYFSNSGGPLIDSYGHVIGVNTATFTRKGPGVSSGVNSAILIDTVVRTMPYLVVYGTSYKDMF